MSDTAIETQDERDEQIAEALTAGRSMRAVRREFSLTEAELDAALERLWPVSTEARIRMIKRDIGCLQRLIEKFYEKALGGCIQSGLLTVRIYERLHSLIGADATRQIDLQIIRPPDAVSSHDKIKAAIMAMVEREQPVRRAAINRLDQLGPERALELLVEANGGDGAAVPSDVPPDDPEPK